MAFELQLLLLCAFYFLVIVSIIALSIYVLYYLIKDIIDMVRYWKWDRENK